jgi:hypothetical protein
MKIAYTSTYKYENMKIPAATGFFTYTYEHVQTFDG